MEAAGFRALSAITSSSAFRAHPLLHLPFSSARMFPSSISSSRFYQLSFSCLCDCIYYCLFFHFVYKFALLKLVSVFDLCCLSWSFLAENAAKRFRVNALHDGVSRVAVESVENKFLQVVLVSPQIPGNTGCIARTCAASAVKLHLVEPLGFQVDDAKLKRAGLDYWPFVVVKVHSSWSEFREYFKQEDGEKRLLAFTKRGTDIHSEFSYRKGDWLVFGSETSGLPPEALIDCKSESLGGGTIRIPMVETYVRCLNLSVSVGIALYEACRQLNYEQLLNSTETCINSIEAPFLTEDIFA